MTEETLFPGGMVRMKPVVFPDRVEMEFHAGGAADWSATVAYRTPGGTGDETFGQDENPPMVFISIDGEAQMLALLHDMEQLCVEIRRALWLPPFDHDEGQSDDR